jgi:hypothetical protein
MFTQKAPVESNLLPLAFGTLHFAVHKIPIPIVFCSMAVGLMHQAAAREVYESRQ